MIKISMQAESNTASLHCEYKGKEYDSKLKREGFAVDLESNIGEAPTEIQDYLDDLEMTITDIMDVLREKEIYGTD
jgi:predicted Rossmann fold nucleotide-binding protein DprA/Smf involved in DNA uptake